MKLEPVRDAAKATNSSAIAIDSATIQLMNIQTTTVERGPLRRRLVQVRITDPAPLMFHAEVVRRDGQPAGSRRKPVIHSHREADSKRSVHGICHMLAVRPSTAAILSSALPDPPAMMAPA